MHRLGTAVARCCDDPLDIQIAFTRRCRTNFDRIVGIPDMERIAVGL